MSKISLYLSYKNILILKHSLEKRIENDKDEYETVRALEVNHELSDETKIFIKEHEEHLRCLDSLIEEMKSVGYRHGKNIFGSKYNY